MKKELIFSAHPDRRSFGAVLRHIFSGAVESRYLAYRMFLKEIKTEYKDAQLGQFWNLANPLVMAVVFVFLFGDGIIETENINMSYGMYVVYGMSLFQVFSQAILLPMGLFTRSSGLLRQVRMNPEALILAQVYHLLFHSLFYIAALLIVSVVMDEYDPVGFLLFALNFPAMILTGLGAGLLMAPLNSIYSDFSQFIGNLIRPLMFLCPTFYRASADNELLTLVNSYNPIAIVMDNLRALAVNGTMVSMEVYVIAVAGLGFLFAVGWLFVNLSLRVLVEKL